jgi:hypothetical protein
MTMEDAIRHKPKPEGLDPIGSAGEGYSSTHGNGGCNEALELTPNCSL